MANQTAAARAIDVFVSAVEAHGGKAEVTTKGSAKLVNVTTAERVHTVRVKGSTGSTWQARKSEAAAGRTPVDAWALVELTNGAVTLVSGTDYAAHVAGLVKTWSQANAGKEPAAGTNLAVTAAALASGKDAWSLLGLDGAAKPAAAAAKTTAKAAAPAKPAAKTAAAKPAAAKKAPAKPAEAKITKIADQRAAAEQGKTPATFTAKDDAEKAPKATAAKSAAKPAAKKTTAAKPAAAKTTAKAAPKAPAKDSASKPAAAKPAAKSTTKAAAKTTTTKPAAKTTPAKTAAAKTSAAKAAPKPAAKAAPKPAAKPAPKATEAAVKANTVEVTKADRTAKAAAATETAEKTGNRQPSGIALLLKRLPVVGRLL